MPSSSTIQLLAGFGLILVTGITLGHQDRIYSLDEDGVIEGLPAAYSPGSLYVGGTEIKLTIGDQERFLPECLNHLFDLPDGEEIGLRGSMHHDLERLPPYFVIELPHKTFVEGWFNGYVLIFNFESLELLEANQLVVSGADRDDLVGMTLTRSPVYSKYCGGPEPRMVLTD